MHRGDSRVQQDRLTSLNPFDDLSPVGPEGEGPPNPHIGKLRDTAIPSYEEDGWVGKAQNRQACLLPGRGRMVREHLHIDIHTLRNQLRQEGRMSGDDSKDIPIQIGPSPQCLRERRIGFESPGLPGSAGDEPEGTVPDWTDRSVWMGGELLGGNVPQEVVG